MEVSVIQERKDLAAWLDQTGVGAACTKVKSAYVKVNAGAHPETPTTDPSLIRAVATYIREQGCSCIVVESASLHLEENLRRIGLGPDLDSHLLHCIDLDEVGTFKVRSLKHQHHIPVCFYNSDVRIGLAVATKRHERIFSAAVKLHVGSVPKEHYQIPGRPEPRAKLHLDLHASVADLYQTIQHEVPFNWHIAGGPYVVGNRRLELPFAFASTDAVALDKELCRRMDVPRPEYLEILSRHTH